MLIGDTANNTSEGNAGSKLDAFDVCAILPFQIGEAAIPSDPHTLVVWNGCYYALQERSKDTVHQGHVLPQEERTAIAVKLIIHLVHDPHECSHAFLMTPDNIPEQVVGWQESSQSVM